MGRGDLEYRSLDVAGVRRGYWLARGPDAAGPLLMVLHGSGMSGNAAGILLEMVTAGSRFCLRRVSGGAAVLSGLEKRLTATTEALMMAAGEPAGVGRA